MELIDLSLIKPMLMRSLENPEAIKLFINYNLGFLGSLELLLLNVFIICSLGYIAYLLRKSKVWKNKDKKERKRIIKDVFIEYLHKAKKPLRKLRYLIIGAILIHCARLIVSGIFHVYNLGLTGYNCQFSPEENILLGYWAFLSLIIFLTAPMFIMFCFGNKFIRNIGILIYIFGIGFISMGRFISIGCAGIEHEEDEEIESIENSGGLKEIEDMKEMNEILGLKNLESYNYIIPDNAEILVEHTKIIEGESVNLSITIMKNGKKMDNYNGLIRITITDENGAILKDNEYTLPNRGFYSFLPSDLGEKEFQKGLTINKEGNFYVEISDLNEFEDKVLGRQKIEVIKKS